MSSIIDSISSPKMKKRARKTASKAQARAKKRFLRFVSFGRHQADAFRDSLPEAQKAAQSAASRAANTAQHLADDLRDQAQPAVDRALKAAGRKPRRSKKPYIAIALFAVLAGIAAYVIFSRRDQEPAYLMTEPDQPDVEPAIGPSNAPETPETPSPSNDGPSVNGSASHTTGEPAVSPTTPQREMAGTPSSGSASAAPNSPSATVSNAPSAAPARSFALPSNGGTSAGLPASAVPPTAGWQSTGNSPRSNATTHRPGEHRAAWGLPH